LRSMVVVCVAGSVLVLGCEESAPPPASAPSGTAPDLKSARERAVGAAQQAAQKVEETTLKLVGTAETKLGEWKGRYEEWRTKGGSLEGEAKAAYDRAAAEFDASVKSAQDKLADLKKASEPDIQRARAELDAAIARAEAAFEELKRLAGG
jgi:hypothetical protein